MKLGFGIEPLDEVLALLLAPDDGAAPGGGVIEDDDEPTLSDSTLDDSDGDSDDLDDDEAASDGNEDQGPDDEEPEEKSDDSDELNSLEPDEEYAFVNSETGETETFTGKELAGLVDIKSRYNQAITELDSLKRETDALKPQVEQLSDLQRSYTSNPLGTIHDMLQQAQRQLGVEQGYVIGRMGVDNETGEQVFYPFDPAKNRPAIPPHFQHELQSRDQRIQEMELNQAAQQEAQKFEAGLETARKRFGGQLTDLHVENLTMAWQNSDNPEFDVVAEIEKRYKLQPATGKVPKKRQTPPTTGKQKRSTPAKPGAGKREPRTAAERARAKMGKPW